MPPTMRPPTIRELVLSGAAIVAAATAATSAVSLYALGVATSIPEPFAAALPIALDVGAGVGALVWITERGELRAWGRGVSVAALVASLTGNGAEGALAAGMLTPDLWLVLAVRASIPAVLFAVIHLAALMARPARASRRTPPVPAAPEVVPFPAGVAVTWEPGDEQSPADWARANWPCKGSEIRMATGCSESYAYKVARNIAAERGATG